MAARQTPRHDLHDELVIVLLICGAIVAIVIGLAMRAHWTQWHNLVVLICLTAIGVALALSRRPRPDDTARQISSVQVTRPRDNAELPALPDFGEIGDIIDIVR